MAMASITDRHADQRRDLRWQPIEAGLDRGGLLVTWGESGTGPYRAVVESAPPPVIGLRPLTPDEVSTVLSVAVRAPSIHNTQPWRFRPQEDCIELLADPDRKLHAVDPDGRELIISCGAALFGLRLGLRQIGRLAAVQLLPDPTEPLLVARVWPAGHAARTRVEADLIAAVPHRHTHRGPFSPGEVHDRLLTAMVTDVAAEGCELALITTTPAVARLGRLVRDAAAEQQQDPDIAAELARWVRPLHSTARDGVPATARLAEGARVTLSGTADEVAGHRRVALRRSARVVSARLAGRDFGLPGTEDGGGESPSGTAVLLTRGDGPADWLRAGQALDRVLLRAATRWVFASLQSQPLESPRHRREVRALLGRRGYPQMVLQFGRANTAIATPRRPHAETLARPAAD
jgi:hypothetical protein